MRWSEAVTLKFVKTYLKHECLWNPAHSEYKLKHQREKAYIAISEEFQTSTGKSLTLREVKLKIKNLRTTYVQQVHKILHKSSPDCIYQPSLVWFHEMDRCLKNIPTNRHTNTYINHSEVPVVDSSCQIWVGQEIQNDNIEMTNPDPLIPPIDDEYDSSKQEESTNNVKKEDISSLLVYKKIKKKKFKHRNSVQEDVTDSCSDSVAKEDEFDIYGKFIASQLRKMELQKALRLQLEIHSLVSEARISDVQI